jgi:hypothetical protein
MSGILPVGLSLLASAVLAEPGWAPGTVWPARVPVRMRVQLNQADLLRWMSEEQGRSVGEVDDDEALAFIAAAGHAVGAEVGDTEASLGLRDTAERTGNMYRVTVIARSARHVARVAGSLREGALLKRGGKMEASVAWALGGPAADRLRENAAFARISRGEWGEVGEVLGELEALARLDPGWLFPPSDALDAWREGPQQGRTPALLVALPAVGVYADPDAGGYGAWDVTQQRWLPVRLFQGHLTEQGRPLALATAVIRLADTQAAPEPDRGRFDVAATGPDGVFLLALRGRRAGVYGRPDSPTLRIGMRKWGFDWAGREVRPGRDEVTEVGQVELSRKEASAERSGLEPRGLMLPTPPGYRALGSWVGDDGGYQRFLLQRAYRPPGWTRLLSSSAEVAYVFDRAGENASPAGWLDLQLDPRAAERALRTSRTRQISARVIERTGTSGQTLVTEQGEWTPEGGAVEYHASEVRLFAFAASGYHVRLQVTAVGLGDRPDYRDPRSVLPTAAQTAGDLSVSVAQALTALAPSVTPIALGGDRLAADQLARLYANLLDAENVSVMLETGEFEPLIQHMPLAGQVFRIDDRPLVFTLGEGCRVVAEPGSRVRLTHDGRLRLLLGRFRLETPEPNAETGNHLSHLVDLIEQANEVGEGAAGDRDFARAVERARRQGWISGSYAEELSGLGRASALRSLFATCAWLASDDTLMIDARMPLLVLGQAELLLEAGDVAALACQTGRAFLGEESFVALSGLTAGERQG